MYIIYYVLYSFLKGLYLLRAQKQANKKKPRYFIDSIETVWSKIYVLEDKKKSIRRQNLKKAIANGKMTLKSKKSK